MPEFDRVIPPGEGGNIEITVNTKGRQGKVRKSVRVHSNDPTKKFTVLTIKGIVKNPVSLSSSSVRIYGEEGRRSTRIIQAKAMLEKPLKLEKEGFTLAERVNCTLAEVEKGRTFEIRFTLLPGPPARLRGRLRLKTNYPEKPALLIPVAVRVVKERDTH